MYGYTLSKKMINSSGEAPSPCLTPILAINSYKSVYYTPSIIPLDYIYIFRISITRSCGNFKLSTNTYHSLALFTLSYARLRSINAMHMGFLVWTLCCISVCKISADSVVL
jgi:hypothetical protein